MFRHQTLFLVAALAAVPAAAQQKPVAAATSTGPDIVVTAVSLKDAKAALKACVDQHCTPDKDIAATLAVAETQFVGGDYKGARSTMGASIHRNHRFAKDYPVPVSNLLRANSRVAVHLGQETEYFSGALDVVSALKSGLPENDPRVLGAQVELGDAYAKTGRIDSAVDLYRKVARRAHALDMPRIEGDALLHVAAIYVAAAGVQNGTYYLAAIDATNALIANPDPRLGLFGQAAAILKAKLAIKHGDLGAIDRLIASYTKGKPATAAILLYAPSIGLPDSPNNDSTSGGTLNKLTSSNFDDQWVDISFQVGPDGKVTDTEVLRKSPKLSGDWVKPIITAVSGRRYAPLASDSPGFFRIERFSFTSALTTVTGSRLLVRSPVPRIESVDLSRDPAVKAGS